MFRLFETIKMINGIPQQLSFHQERMENSCRMVHEQGISFSLLNDLPEWSQKYPGIWKIRLFYDPNQFHFECEPYVIKKVGAYYLVQADELNYSHKYIDRDPINQLIKGKPENTDIIIIQNGRVTDASYANMVFKTETGKLVTPSSCLLPGTKRQKYLLDKRIVEQEIRTDQIARFTEVCRINAMMDLDEDDWVSTSMIFNSI